MRVLNKLCKLLPCHHFPLNETNPLGLPPLCFGISPHENPLGGANTVGAAVAWPGEPDTAVVAADLMCATFLPEPCLPDDGDVLLSTPGDAVVVSGKGGKIQGIFAGPSRDSSSLVGDNVGLASGSSSSVNKWGVIDVKVGNVELVSSGSSAIMTFRVKSGSFIVDNITDFNCSPALSMFSAFATSRATVVLGTRGRDV